MGGFKIMKSPPVSSTYGGAMASEPLYCVHTHTWEQTSLGGQDGLESLW